MISKVRAVVFDLDGVMVDSEDLHFEAYRILFEREFGEVFLQNDYGAFLGKRRDEIIAEYLRQLGIEGDAQALALEKDDIYFGLLKKNFKPVPGVIALVHFLKKRGIRLAVASSSMPAHIEFVLESLGVRGDFEAVANGGEVKRAKPAPDVFLLAAKRLGLSPKDCLVIEDAPNGVAAAKAAGMLVFAVPSKHTAKCDFSNADKVFSSLEEANNYLKRHNEVWV